MPGLRVGGARISQKYDGFMVNDGRFGRRCDTADPAGADESQGLLRRRSGAGGADYRRKLNGKNAGERAEQQTEI